MRVNGERYPHRAGLTLRELVADLALDPRTVVVMHGETIYRGASSEIPEAPLAEQDVIEIVTMMQGG
jgi:thiamine biosynthesis protein ThiS